MSRIAYVNGQYRDLRDASVNIEDRGYQFADGVYEVCEVRGGKLVDFPRHMARLERSLRELRIAMPMPLRALDVVMHEVVRRNRIGYGLVYLQVTRGVAAAGTAECADALTARGVAKLTLFGTSPRRASRCRRGRAQ